MDNNEYNGPKNKETTNSVVERRPHFIFTADNPAYPDKVKLKMSNNQMIRQLKRMGMRAEKMKGKYGDEEESILVHDVPEDQTDKLLELAHDLGQESSIYSDGYNHIMFFHHGENAGRHLRGEGTEMHKRPPSNYYSQMDDGTVFTHNFNDTEYHDNSPIKKFEVLQKTPHVDDEYEDINWPYHPTEEGEYNKTINHKKTGNKIHVVHSFDRDDDTDHHTGSIYYITENGHKKGKPIARLQVQHLDHETGDDNSPHVNAVLVNPEHRGKGLGTMLHMAALKDYGNLGSDYRLSPGSQKIWEKLSRHPQLETKLSPTDTHTVGKFTVFPQDTRHEVRVKKPIKYGMAKSEDQDDHIYLEHYSPKSGLKAISPEFSGTGVDRSQRAAANRESQFSFYYPHGYEQPEQFVTSKAKSKYTVRVPKESPIFDSRVHGSDIINQVKDENRGAFNLDHFVKKLKEAGFHGFKSRPQGVEMVAMFNELPVHSEEKVGGFKMFKAELNKSEYKGYPVKLNPEHGAKIAQAYEQMKHDPNHPDVQAAYGALIDETKKQYQDILNSGIKLSPIHPHQGNPYRNSKDVHRDIEENNHLWYFPTEHGYGSGDETPDHPMLQETEFEIGGKKLLANDLFRIVHDINGHHLGGKSGFGPTGEHKAFLTHRQMYSPLAQKALATETLGQNSWVNFGPHGEHNRTNPHQTIYADQKAGLLPDEIVHGDWHIEDTGLNKFEIDLQKTFAPFRFKSLPKISSRPDQQIMPIETERQAKIATKTLQQQLRRAGGGSADMGEIGGVLGPVVNEMKNTSERSAMAQKTNTPKIKPEIERRKDFKQRKNVGYDKDFNKDVTRGPAGVQVDIYGSPETKAFVPKPYAGTPIAEHEAHHYMLGQIEAKYGDRARRNVARSLLSNLDDEQKTYIKNFIKSKGYDPKTSAFNEEAVNHIHDILSHKPTRDQFLNQLKSKGVKRFRRGEIISGLKRSWKKIHRHAAQITEQDLGKSEDIQKGALKRIAPFKPQKDADIDEMYDTGNWQHESGSYDGSMEPHEYRDALPRMSGNVRKRMLNKLMGQTKYRRNEDGSFSFLLHRGVSGKERRKTVLPSGHITHDVHSSWTPDINTARGFAMDYREAGEPYKNNAISAWIHEKDIHHMPMMLGRVPHPRLGEHLSEEGDEWTHGSNAYGHEKEVIVNEHKSPLAHPDEIDPHMTPTNIHEKIAQNVRSGTSQKERAKDFVTRAGLRQRFKKHEELEKNMKGIRAGIIASVIGASSPAKAAMTSQDFSEKPVRQTVSQIENQNPTKSFNYLDHSQRWPENNKGHILNAIAMTESSGGKNTKHARLPQGGLHRGERAFGMYGLTPVLIRDTIKAHKDLARNYGHMLKLRGEEFHKEMDKNPHLETIVASRHYDRVASHFGHDPAKIGYAWLNGIGGTYKAMRNGLNPNGHWHAQKILKYYKNSKNKQEEKKQEPKQQEVKVYRD